VKLSSGTVLALIAGCLSALFLGLAYLVFARNPSELVQRDALRDLGVLVSMDGTGQYVSSVNFATLNEDASFHKALGIVASLREIKSLDLSRTTVTNVDTELIGNLTSLTSLSLVEANVGDEAIPNLSRLKSLLALHLSGTKVTDACAPQIASITSLKILDISGTNLRGEFEPLSDMPHLEWLVVSRLELKDGALRSLQTAPALKRVSLKEAKFASKELDGLRASRPGIVIDE
jgi:Leucine-rich repeat (LRR) protein